jgi:hypothetical protein
MLIVCVQAPARRTELSSSDATQPIRSSPPKSTLSGIRLNQDTQRRVPVFNYSQQAIDEIPKGAANRRYVHEDASHRECECAVKLKDDNMVGSVKKLL